MGNKSEANHETINNIRNTSLQGVTGQNVIAGDGNSVTNVMTDQGAIDAAGGLAIAALDAHSGNTKQLFDVAGALFENQGETNRETLRTADAMAEKAIKNSLSYAGETQAQAGMLLSQAINSTSATSAQAMARQNSLAEKAVNSAQAMAEKAQTGGQIVVAESMTKIMYALAGVTGLVVLVMFFKGSK